MKTGINPRTLATRWSRNWPEPIRGALGPAGDWLDMMLVDHGVLRELYLNLHEVTPGLWRSAQPSPGAIRMLAARGIKTILNLRGARACGSYILEQRACQQVGIALIDMPFDSRGAPSATRVQGAAETFAKIEYPALLHCKSGADRAGIVSALYLILHEGKPVAEARKQLALRYGHVRQALTGVLDHFLDVYEADHKKTGCSLLEWVSSADYDHAALTQHFRANVMANFLVDRVLGRE
jgi:protein tyrosine/serine phosphatase